MSDELEGLRNIVAAARVSEYDRVEDHIAAYRFWSGGAEPPKPTRRMRLSWWLRDKRRVVAGWIYPEGKDYDPFW